MKSTLIQGGTVADGNGGTPFRADVRIAGRHIAEVCQGLVPLPGETVIDATGLLVTPGFVDLHTHYDGQATWDEQLAPSCWHGVTTVIMGNCGVGFAPVRPGAEQGLVELMEGVEDIPGTALHEGMSWGWESFGEYLDVLAERRWMMDVGTQVPHAAVRAYVMGDRALEPQASADEIARMRDIVREGMVAGALGISTTRILAHRTSVGDSVPGTFADEAEMRAFAGVLQELGTGVFEVVPRGMDGEVSDEAHAELDWMGRVAEETGRPVVFSLVQTHTEFDRFRLLMDRSAEMQQRGTPIYPVVAARPTGILWGLDSRHFPFCTRPGYMAIEHLPRAERAAMMRQPEVRARILAEPNGDFKSHVSKALLTNFGNMFPVKVPINWEPTTEETMAGLAAREGVTAEEYCYDYLAEGDGGNLILRPTTNYNSFTLKEVHEMLTHPASIYGLGDGGAHCGMACDASSQTLMLSFWTRDRSRGPRLEVGAAVRMMSRDTAEVYGLQDRGRIEPGYRADINIIDYDNLEVLVPEMINDLPTGARRLMQRAKGYVATFVAGEQTIANDTATGALPGQLIRGSRPLQGTL